jgi:hypothetical protein
MSKWENVAKNVEALDLDHAARQKAYRGTVHVTILAENKREARKALESIGGISGLYGPQVRVESREGPHEIAIPNN